MLLKSRGKFTFPERPPGLAATKKRTMREICNLKFLKCDYKTPFFFSRAYARAQAAAIGVNVTRKFLTEEKSGQNLNCNLRNFQFLIHRPPLYKRQHARGSTCRGWLRRRTFLDRTRAWGGKGTHTGVLPLRQDRGRAPGPPGKIGTRPGCRVLPAAGRSRRSGARRELTRARSGDRQARVVGALAPG